jgi:multisubunit Na+/H+ antiporter MnhB subunit
MQKENFTMRMPSRDNLFNLALAIGITLVVITILYIVIPPALKFFISDYNTKETPKELQN